jgi:hypothetical protein
MHAGVSDALPPMVFLPKHLSTSAPMPVTAGGQTAPASTHDRISGCRRGAMSHTTVPKCGKSTSDHRTCHVLATTHRGLDLAVSSRTLRHIHRRAVVQRQHTMFQFLAAPTTSHAPHAHPTFRTRVCRHGSVPPSLIILSTYNNPSCDAARVRPMDLLNMRARPVGAQTPVEEHASDKRPHEARQRRERRRGTGNDLGRILHSARNMLHHLRGRPLGGGARRRLRGCGALGGGDEVVNGGAVSRKHSVNIGHMILTSSRRTTRVPLDAGTPTYSAYRRSRSIIVALGCPTSMR